MNTTENSFNGLTPNQQALNDLWDAHVRSEFATKGRTCRSRYDDARRLCESRARADRRSRQGAVRRVLRKLLHSPNGTSC
jgi:hypothetical protein